MKNRLIKFLKEKLGLYIFTFFVWLGFNVFTFYVISIKFDLESYNNFKQGLIAGASAMYLLERILDKEDE